MHDLTSKYVGKVKGVNPNLSFIEHEINRYRILTLPGGTRSGKTQSVLRWIWKNLHTHSGVEYTIVRKTLTALKQTALKDFVEIGIEFGLYSERYHNRTEQIYNYNGNRVLFLGGDDGEKLRGCAQDVLYLNEAPEMEWEPVKQLLMRTRHKTIMDYNPSYPESWIYDNIHTRDTTASLTTTYADNPHISVGELEEILWMKDNDPESYKIYGLGERGELRGQVYKNWTKIKEMPVDYPPSFVIDFGFANDPCVLAKFSSHNRAIYGKQCMYQVGVNNDVLGIHMYYAGVRAQTHVLADSAEPKSIAELNRGWDVTEDWLKGQCKDLGYEYTPELLKVMKEGYTVFAVKKGADTIDAGIQKVKQYEVLIEDSSHDAWKEYRQYRWMEDPKTGKLLNKPIDQHNHYCFVADTLVTTGRGEVPIVEVKKGDTVLTSKGYRTVLHNWDNGDKLTSKYRLQFDTFYVSLESTPDHLIKTDKGWVQISELKSGMTVYLTKSLMVKSTDYTQRKDISAEGLSDSTGLFGRTTMAQYLKDFTYTIKTKTRGIIALITSNCYHAMNTFQSICGKDLKTTQSIGIDSIRQESRRLRRGISLKKVKSGIERMASIVGIKSRKNLQITAKFAGSSTHTSTAHPKESTAMQTAKLLHLEEGERQNNRVYDLTVDGVHEYFANGVLVHNCDTLRYYAMYLMSLEG